MLDQEVWRPLFVSSVVGGSSPENRTIRAAIRRLAQTLNILEWQDGVEETGVDVIFHVTGPLLEPDYTGIRVGRFSKVRRIVAIQVAVPPALDEDAEDRVTSLLAEYLVEATELANADAARRKNVLPVGQAVRLAQRVAESVVGNVR